MHKTPLILGTTTLMLGPLLAKTIRDQKLQIGAARRGDIELEDFVELAVSLTLASAQRVDPTISREQIEDLIDLENMKEAFAVCMGVSVPAPEPGEPQAAVNPPT